MKVEEGLDLTDVVPRTSPEHEFVKARSKYFSFYQMAIVTKGEYNYPNGQELLYKFHDAFKKVKPWSQSSNFPWQYRLLLLFFVMANLVGAPLAIASMVQDNVFNNLPWLMSETSATSLITLTLATEVRSTCDLF